MNKFNLDIVLKKVEQTKREVPKKVANLTQNYFVLSWKNQGFDNKAWQEVQRRIPGTPEFKYPKNKGLSRRTKPILVQSGELRRRVANSVVTANWNKVLLVVDLPYAAAMNNGTGKQSNATAKTDGRAGQQRSDFNGARPFIGQTNELTAKQASLIEREFSKIWD